MHFCQQPPPHPRLRKEIPIHFCRQPPPRPRLRRRIPIHLCRHPPPRPRLRRSSPAPAGRGQCVAISGEQPYPGCNRGEAVFGSSPAYSRALDRVDIAIGGGGPRGGGTRSPSLVSHAPSTLLLVAGISARDTHALLPAAPTPPAPSALLPRPAGRGQCVAISGEQPYLGCNRWEAVHWTVGISPRGVGLTGRGNSFPLPCLSRSKHLASRCRHFCEGYPGTSASSPHPARACGAPPPPRRGGGSAWRYQGSSRIRGATGGKPCPALLQNLPMCWTVGISPLGEAARGAGEQVPPPLSLTLQIPCSLPALSRPAFSRQATHALLPAAPTPPAPSALRPLPGGGRGPCVAIPGGQPCPGLSRLIPMHWTVVDMCDRHWG